MLWRMKSVVEKHKSDWIKTRYQYQFLKAKMPIPVPEDVFPAHFITQQLDNFNPEIKVQ